MDAHSDPFSSDCLWYYLIVVSAAIIVAWTFILIGCFSNPCKELQQVSEAEPAPHLRWPANLQVWGPTTPMGNLLLYLVWTAVVLMLMWAFFHSTCDDAATNDMRNIHRGIFLVLMLLAIADFMLFFLIHNVVAALVANVFSLALVIGSIIMFSTLPDDDSWFAFPMLLWLCYRIYALMSVLALNPNHPEMNNHGILL